MDGDVLVDNQMLGWAKENEPLILKHYSRIQYLGEGSNPGMASKDSELAAFCKAKGYDMLTCDKKAYTSLLDKGMVEEIRISLFGMNDQSGQPVYRLKLA